MRFELPEKKKLTLEMVIPIRWGDMDAMGHVNNTIYFRYLEIVRIEWLHRVMGAPDPAGEGPVIVNTFCNFLRQLKYPGDVLAKHYVARPGRSSFEAYVTLERTDEPSVLYASGGAKTVWLTIDRSEACHFRLKSGRSFDDDPSSRRAMTPEREITWCYVNRFARHLRKARHANVAGSDRNRVVGCPLAAAAAPVEPQTETDRKEIHCDRIDGSWQRN